MNVAFAINDHIIIHQIANVSFRFGATLHRRSDVKYLDAGTDGGEARPELLTGVRPKQATEDLIGVCQTLPGIHFTERFQLRGYYC